MFIYVKIYASGYLVISTHRERRKFANIEFNVDKRVQFTFGI